MTLDLPQPIVAYFTADQGNGEAVADCFTESAVVKDEGHVHHGRAAIKKWKAEASSKYQYTSEPIACEQQDRKFVVTCRLTGNFPGSPVNLRYFFQLSGEQIVSLEIVP